VLTIVTGVKAVNGSIGILRFVCLITVKEPVPVNTMLLPSDAPLATACMPTIDPPPDIFSTKTLWPMAGASFFASILPMMSVDPPGLNGTTIRTGPFGQFAASAVDAAKKVNEKMKVRHSN